MVSHALQWSQNPLTVNGLSQLLACFSGCYFIQDAIFTGRKRERENEPRALQISWLLLCSVITKANQHISTCDFRWSTRTFEQPGKSAPKSLLTVVSLALSIFRWLLTFWILSSTPLPPSHNSNTIWNPQHITMNWKISEIKLLQCVCVCVGGVVCAYDILCVYMVRYVCMCCVGG